MSTLHEDTISLKCKTYLTNILGLIRLIQSVVKGNHTIVVIEIIFLKLDFFLRNSAHGLVLLLLCVIQCIIASLFFVLEICWWKLLNKVWYLCYIDILLLSFLLCLSLMVVIALILHLNLYHFKLGRKVNIILVKYFSY